MTGLGWALLGGAALLAYGLARVGGLMRSTQAASRVRVVNGQLVGPQGSVQLDETDLLWLGRALYGETRGSSYEAAAAVAWCLAQNWALVRRSVVYPRFTDLIRAYSIPTSADYVNPQSAKCRANPDLCTAARIATRQAIQSMAWSELPATCREVASAFVGGRLPNPVPGAVDFAAYRFPGATTEVGGNWFGVGASRRLV